VAGVRIWRSASCRRQTCDQGLRRARREWQAVHLEAAQRIPHSAQVGRMAPRMVRTEDQFIHNVNVMP
jgi:hypothetical protein